MPNQRLFKFINIFSYIFLLLNALVVPLFFDKNLTNFYIIPKQYVFMAIVLVNLLLFAAKIVLSKNFPTATLFWTGLFWPCSLPV